MGSRVSGIMTTEKDMVATTLEKVQINIMDAPDHRLAPDRLMVPAGDEEKRLQHTADQLLPAQLEGIWDSKEQALLMPVGDIETGSYRSNLPAENGASSTARKEVNLKLHLKVSLLLMTISMITLINTLPSRSANMLPLALKLTAFFSFTAFVSAICLVFHTLQADDHHQPINSKFPKWFS